MGDHSAAGLKSFYVPSPWHPKSGCWLVTLRHSAPYFSLHICQPCSMRFPAEWFPLLGWISCPRAVLCLDANMAREVHFRQDNKLLWGTLGRHWRGGGNVAKLIVLGTAPSGSKNAAEHAAEHSAFLFRPACVQYPKQEQYTAVQGCCCLVSKVVCS